MTIRVPEPDTGTLARKAETVTALKRLLPTDGVISDLEETRTCTARRSQ